MRNDLIFRIYWDGRSTPSVESPIALFLEMDGTSIMNMLHSHWQLVLQMGLVWFLISRCLLPMVPFRDRRIKAIQILIASIFM